MSASDNAVSSSDFVRAMGPVARELLGVPSEEKTSELRFGSRGSLSVSLDKGTWHDHEADVGGGLIDLVMAKRRVDKEGALSWLRDRKHLPPNGHSSGFNVVATYPYTDADGVLLYEVCRLDPKDFRQRRPDGSGRWAWTMKGVERVLYHLSEVKAAAREGRVVYIAEGEKGVDALRQLGVVATCSPGGANKWKHGYSDHLRGAEVVILPDNDQPGRQHADMVAASLRKATESVTILALPGLATKEDPFDWVQRGGTADQLETLATAERLAQSAKGSDGAENIAPQLALSDADDPLRPVIRVAAGKLDLLATEGEAALRNSRLPVYQRGDGLVRPVSREVPASRGRVTVAAGLSELNNHSLLDLLSQCATWKVFNQRKKALVSCDPPGLVAAIILSRKGQWKLPPIAGVITTPTLRSDGSILLEPGYDPATRLFHVADPSLDLGTMPIAPTRAEAETALAALKGLLTGFPFVTEVDRAVALSGLITPIVRGALTVAPLHAFRASTAGSGKSYLVDVARRHRLRSGLPCRRRWSD
jgi:putative DNA primase/helicase